jgi:hypothetical protein
MRRVIVPKVPLESFLMLTRDLRSNPRFHLSNQDVRDGMICFRTPEGFRVLSEAIDFHNTGMLPPSSIYKKKVSEARMKKLGFDMPAWIESLESAKQRGPDSNGFYTTRCPNCARKGKDSDSNHLAYTHEGVVHCHAHCKFFDIIYGFYNAEGFN